MKSILDIPATLEYLETQGVPTVTLSMDAKADFPAFFTPASGFKAMATLPSTAACARFWLHHEALGLQNGAVFAAPIPPSLAPDGELIDLAISQALREAEARGVTGKQTTPFLLQRVAELTDGRSLQSNIALVKNNAVLGARIAVEHALLKTLHDAETDPPRGVDNDSVNGGGKSYVPHGLANIPQTARVCSTTNTPAACLSAAPFCSAAAPAHETLPKKLGALVQAFQRARTRPHGDGSSERIKSNHLVPPPQQLTPRRPVVVGGATVDLVARAGHAYTLTQATSTPGTLTQSFGGVARNIAEALARLQAQPLLLTVLGSDALGDALAGHCRSLGLDEAGLSRDTHAGTAVYNAMLDAKGELHAAVFDGGALAALTPALLQSAVHAKQLALAAIIVFDGNLSRDAARHLVAVGSAEAIPVWFEPTSVTKAALVCEPGLFTQLTVVSPNALEAAAMRTALDAHSPALIGEAMANCQLPSAADLKKVPADCLDAVQDALELY